MNTYNSFNVMLDNKNTAANYTIAAVLTMYKIFLQVFMYVSRISLFGCSLRHSPSSSSSTASVRGISYPTAVKRIKWSLYRLFDLASAGTLWSAVFTLTILLSFLLHIHVHDLPFSVLIYP